MTMILCASRTAVNRWAVMTTVLPLAMKRMLFWMIRSDSWSGAEEASSKIRMRGLVMGALMLQPTASRWSIRAT